MNHVSINYLFKIWILSQDWFCIYIYELKEADNDNDININFYNKIKKEYTIDKNIFFNLYFFPSLFSPFLILS